VTEKKALLLKAFDEGAVVIIDEINSAPMMEQFLNSLLMGRNPENGTRPKKPGFFVIGTQNPITMAGRRAPSTAFSRRLITYVLGPYPDNEMRHIFMRRGIPEQESHHLVDAFKNQSKFARVHQLKPPPTFRDLLRLAETLLKSPMIPDMPVSTEQRDKTLSQPPNLHRDKQGTGIFSTSKKRINREILPDEFKSTTEKFLKKLIRRLRRLPTQSRLNKANEVEAWLTSIENEHPKDLETLCRHSHNDKNLLQILQTHTNTKKQDQNIETKSFKQFSKLLHLKDHVETQEILEAESGTKPLTH